MQSTEALRTLFKINQLLNSIQNKSVTESITPKREGKRQGLTSYTVTFFLLHTIGLL